MHKCCAGRGEHHRYAFMNLCDWLLGPACYAAWSCCAAVTAFCALLLLLLDFELQPLS